MYEDEAADYWDPEVPVEDEEVGRAEGDEEDADNVVVSGDPSAAANSGKGNEKSHRDKKIPDDQRTTTPYMTKYERARILGTRALQIRYDGAILFPLHDAGHRSTLLLTRGLL